MLEETVLMYIDSMGPNGRTGLKRSYGVFHSLAFYRVPAT